MLVTEEVSKEERSRDVNLEQLENILFMVVTEEVSKEERSRDVEVQKRNICYMSVMPDTSVRPTHSSISLLYHPSLHLNELLKVNIFFEVLGTYIF